MYFIGVEGFEKGLYKSEKTWSENVYLPKNLLIYLFQKE